MIDRSSPVAYYEQLYDLLREQVQNGTVPPGERLPGESQLHRDFGLSRATVRQALDMLETNGWAHKVPRRGYVAGAPSTEQGWLIEGRGGFLEREVGHGNPLVSTEVIRAERANLPDHAAAALEIPRQSSGFVLERRRKVGDEVALYSTNFAPAPVAAVISAAPTVLDGTSSLTEALAAGGYTAVGAHRVIHALPAPATIAAALGVAKGSALLRIRSTTWDQSQVPFDYYETWLRSEVVPLVLNASMFRPVAAAGH